MTGTDLDVVVDDLTTLDVDAIVNAANERMLGGGGVDGAIHRAAGPGLLDECRSIAEVRPGVRCPTGEARVTGGHALPARHVIHTVGPVWHGGDRDEPGLLRAAYRSSLDAARQVRARSVAFPAISCGVYGYPHDQAADIAVATVRDAVAEHPDAFDRIVFCCFDAAMARHYQQALAD